MRVPSFPSSPVLLFTDIDAKQIDDIHTCCLSRLANNDEIWRHWNIEWYDMNINISKICTYAIKELHDDSVFHKCCHRRNFIFFRQADTHSFPRHPREINYVTIHVDIKYHWSGGENLSRPNFVPLFPFIFLCSLPFPAVFFFFSLSPSSFRSADILPVPIVKHPRRRYAIVALWVAWEPERAYSGIRLGILTCWTFVVELSALCPRCVYVVIRCVIARDEFCRA